MSLYDKSILAEAIATENAMRHVELFALAVEDSADSGTTPLELAQLRAAENVLGALRSLLDLTVQANNATFGVDNCKRLRME